MLIHHRAPVTACSNNTWPTVANPMTNRINTRSQIKPYENRQRSKCATLSSSMRACTWGPKHGIRKKNNDSRTKSGRSPKKKWKSAHSALTHTSSSKRIRARIGEDKGVWIRRSDQRGARSTSETNFFNMVIQRCLSISWWVKQLRTTLGRICSTKRWAMKTQRIKVCQIRHLWHYKT